MGRGGRRGRRSRSRAEERRHGQERDGPLSQFVCVYSGEGPVGRSGRAFYLRACTMARWRRAGQGQRAALSAVTSFRLSPDASAKGGARATIERGAACRENPWVRFFTKRFKVRPCRR